MIIEDIMFIRLVQIFIQYKQKQTLWLLAHKKTIPTV
jgi:hypothetical protein